MINPFINFCLVTPCGISIKTFSSETNGSVSFGSSKLKNLR